jgi:hypothetical protein
LRKRAVVRISIVVLCGFMAAAVFAVLTRAGNPRFDQIQTSLAPNPVTAGGNVLYKAQWHYIDNQTLTHPQVEITVPAGWTLVSPSDPTGCTQSGTLITCPRDTIRTGDYVRQTVELTTTPPLGTQTVTSRLGFYEGPINPGRIQRVQAPDASTLVISSDPSVEPNRAGKCVDNGETVSTATGVGGSNTTATGPPATDLCTPISIVENARSSSSEACLPAPYQCVEDIVETNAPFVSTTNPIPLTITFYGTGLNNLPLIFTSLTRQTTVAQCTGAGASPDPCYTGHVARQRSVTWSLRWSGADPTWTG